jgi:hypothetical protein
MTLNGLMSTQYSNFRGMLKFNGEVTTIYPALTIFDYFSFSTRACLTYDHEQNLVHIIINSVLVKAYIMYLCVI